MMMVSLDPDLDALLRQIGAGLDLSPEETAKVMLESALIMSVTTS